MKPISPVQKNNLVVFTPEYFYRYTWYTCIAMMICTSLQEYLYPLIQRKSIPQNSLVTILTHTRNCKTSIGVLDRAVLKVGKYKA